MNRLSHHVAALLNLGAVGLLLSILLYERFDFPGKEKVISVAICLILALFSLLVIAHALQLSLYLIRAHGQMVIGGSREYTCTFLGDTGTLADTVCYTLRNFSFSAQRTIFNDSEGFPVPTEYSPVYFLERRSKLPSGDLKIVGCSTPVPLTAYKDYASGGQIHQGIWALTLDPPLLPFESVTFVRHSIDKAVAQEAFSSDGTEFIFRVRIPFRLLSVVIHAPTGYALRRVATSIDSQAGKPIRVPRRKGTWRVHNMSTFAWRVTYPDPALRYKVRFSLTKWGST